MIRDERPGDAGAIRALTTLAFAPMPYASGTEAEIVDGLREAGALTLSLVAEDEGEVVGHIAFSPVTIDGRELGWFGLGPVSVAPDLQRRGIGSALIREGLARLASLGAKGCVLLGDPGYYRRFGFAGAPGLRYPPAPAEHFMALVLSGAVPEGVVTFHEAFS